MTARTKSGLIFALVARWDANDYYTLVKHDGETTITGSGSAGLKLAVEYAKPNRHDYKHIRREIKTISIIYNLDGSMSDHPTYQY